MSDGNDNIQITNDENEDDVIVENSDNLPSNTSPNNNDDIDVDEEEEEDIFGNNNDNDDDILDDEEGDEEEDNDEEAEVDSDIDVRDGPAEDDDLVDSDEEEPKRNADGLLVVKKVKKKSKVDKKSKKEKKRKFEEEGSKKKKRNKKSKYKLFDEEAVVGEDEDEEDDNDNVYNKESEEIVDAFEKEARARVERRKIEERELHGLSAEEIAEQYRLRHKIAKNNTINFGNGVDDGTTSIAVAQQSLLPSINDPKVFKIKCKPGFEIQLVRSIMMKAIDMRNNDGYFKIKSAFSTSTKGVVYVESLNETFAKDTLKGLRLLYSTTFAQISIPEMTTVMNVSMKKKPLQVGQFVRLKRGILKGDLARVVGLFDGGQKAFIQAVPRPDYNETLGEKAKSTNKTRPQQRLFDAEEAKKTGQVMRKHHPLDNSGSSTPFDCWNNEHYRDGFLYKEVSVATFLDNSNVNERFEELVLFNSKMKSSNRDDDEENEEQKGENNDNEPSNNFIKDLAEQIQNLDRDRDDNEGANMFLPGDLVKIRSGDLQNLEARIVSINDSTKIAQVISKDNLLKTEMSVELHLLMKWVYVGVHVKVIAGRYLGQTGRVVEVKEIDEESIAFLVADGTCADIQCNVRHLQMSSEVTIGQGNLMGYELYDLVAINDRETAVIINVGMDKLRVINQMDKVTEVSPQELMGKRNHMSGPRALAIDSEQNEIRVGDTVHVTSGIDHLKLAGTIKHISKGILWLHSNTYLKNSGIFVTRARNCVVVGSKSAKMTLSNSYKGVFQQPLPVVSTGSGSANASPASSNLGSKDKSNVNSGPRRFGERSEFIGKTVKIMKGKFKGFLGQVIEVTDTHFQLELLAKMKKVIIDRKEVSIVGDKNGSADAVNRQITNQSYIPSTPFLTQATPNHIGSETPKYFSGETPLHVESDYARTPRVDSGEYWTVGEKDENMYEDSASIQDTSISSSTKFSQGNLWSSSHQNTDNTAYSGVSYGGSVGYSPAPINSSKKSGSSSSITFREWQENMLVTVKKGKYIGKIACIQKPADEDGNLRVIFRDGYGNLIGDEISLKCDDVGLSDPFKNGNVIVVSGNYKGTKGIVQMITGNDIVLRITVKDKIENNLFKLSDVALINL